MVVSFRTLEKHMSTPPGMDIPLMFLASQLLPMVNKSFPLDMTIVSAKLILKDFNLCTYHACTV